MAALPASIPQPLGRARTSKEMRQIVSIRNRTRPAPAIVNLPEVRERSRLRIVDFGEGAETPSETASPNLGGRPSKFTIETERAILAAVREGTPLKFAAQKAGVSYATLNRWTNTGKQDERDGNESPLCSFYRQICAAEAHAVSLMAKTVIDAAPENWQAAAWYLERRAYEDFARKDKLTHSGRIDSATVGVTINVDRMREDIPDGSLIRILQKVRLSGRAPALAAPTDIPGVELADVAQDV